MHDQIDKQMHLFETLHGENLSKSKIELKIHT